MLDREYARLMAEYNAWMNEKVYQACAPLSDEERRRDRGAFFKSIHQTLHHLLWADRAFLIRLLAWDLPIGKPTDVLAEDFVEMTHERALRRADPRLGQDVPGGLAGRAVRDV